MLSNFVQKAASRVREPSFLRRSRLLGSNLLTQPTNPFVKRCLDLRSCASTPATTTVAKLADIKEGQPSVSTSQPAAAQTNNAPLNVFVKKEGDMSWAEVSVLPSLFLSDLLGESVKTLPSLSGKNRRSLTMHQVTRDKDGKEVLGDALDSTVSVEKALDLTQTKVRIVIKAATANTAGQRAGTGTGTAEAELLRAAILAAVPEPIHGAKSGARLIRLPHQAKWPQLGAEPLFVRHFYQDCYEGPLKRLEPGGRFIIRGNAGIGKSAFGLYLLYQAIRADRTAVHISDQVKRGCIFNKDGRVHTFLKRDFERDTDAVLDDQHTVLIFDGDGDGSGAPPLVPATTVLVTSPKRSRYKVFQQTKVDHLVFPVFSRAEIEDMLTSCFSQLDNKRGRACVWERYRKWGGIPRDLLHLLDEADQMQLENAVTGIDLDGVADVLVKNDIEDDALASHRLFHLKPRGETDEGFTHGDKASAYALARIELGSPYIALQVAKAIQQSR